ncbi:chemotaxis protein CheW [Aliidiomarina maris]|uniref:Chemotaxis protein CheW n=1 Tax=Aliidiomarina maris TaxID=531312 RepID=A0A327X2Y7_9GAMM|nr:chemotaxis protein CheW [Aliidiomarina maris]RAK00768.1 purine-binding chemotaxis protein CheW [Aliidiomarina maris]RUO27234.1 chemotaxis protein CheW [Aliidiomarina maris]
MSRVDQQRAMHEYLDALLFEEDSAETTLQPQRLAKDAKAPNLGVGVAEPDTQQLEKLLAQAALKQSADLEAEFARAAELEREQQARAEAEAAAKAQRLAQERLEQERLEQARLEQERLEQEKIEQAQREQPAVLAEVPPPPVSNMKDYQEGNFQALFFSVAGLKLAVPLKSLGGIHQWKEPNTIFGKPAWYLGIMTNREEKLNVVDTAQWVMPEKYNDAMAEAIDYQYLIMLGESRWGLACETLVTTQTLSPDDVQWRQNSAGKRPWLAGVVREKMCAILDVDAMIDMLEQGLNSQG